ncbi:MAG TPA: hypothetical protein VK589_30110 [Chryseolinea sp.]|nr:hypothetical protein [Chryseolinea sp.]
MNKGLVIGIGVTAAVAALAYYLYNKNKTTSSSAAMLPASPGYSTSAPGQITMPASTLPPAVKQTMWKDVDGNLFELTGDKQRWGYVIKVNGSIQGKNNQMEVMTLGPDGHMVGADNNGSVFVYKNNGWQNVVRDNKTAAAEYLAKLGVKYPTGAFNGLGSTYLLS